MEDSEKKATWWNCRKCSGKKKVVYTTQHNCFYNPRGGGGFHYTIGKDSTETVRINFVTLDPYCITHFFVSENCKFFLPGRV